MNKLKFRVWDKATKTMHKENSGFFLFTNGVLGFNSGNSYEILNKEDFVLMQFSDKHDCTGKEIFEGDIITVDNGLKKEPIITICKWEDAGFILADNFGGSWTRQLFNQQERLTVIGNIYQHPELLESVQK